MQSGKHYTPHYTELKYSIYISTCLCDAAAAGTSTGKEHHIRRLFQSTLSDQPLEIIYKGKGKKKNRKNIRQLGICRLCTRDPIKCLDWVQCDSCGQWYHCLCLKLTKEEAEGLDHFTCPMGC